MKLVGGLYRVKKVREFDSLDAFYSHHNRLLKECEFNPDWRAHFDLAVSYFGVSQMNEAFAYAQKALTYTKDLDPEDSLLAGFICLVLMGDMYFRTTQPDKAVSFYRQALDLGIESDELMTRMGRALIKMNRLDAALQSFNHALKINPDNFEAFIERYIVKRELCDWSDYREETDKLKEIALYFSDDPHQTVFLVPHYYLMFYDDPEGLLSIARHLSLYLGYEKKFFLKECRDTYARADKNVLRIGYISNDFNNHPKGHLISRMFKLHDRSRVKTYVYSYSPNDGSDYLKRIQQDCDVFVDISGLNTTQMSERIYQDQIDILVDMKGYTEDAQIGVFIRKPAPIIVNYLGWPGTTGSPFIDYLIADHEVVPEDMRPYYSESIAYLPNCYQANDKHQDVAERPATKQEAGLPEGKFIFCSFNRSLKLDPDTFSDWMDILKRVPESVLWLYVHPESIQASLIKEAAKHGISQDRLIFARRVKKSEHLARLRFADLFLDIPVCNAHVTGTDLLLAGVPILTCRGKQFAARVASSLLKAIGLPELITNSMDEYKALAIKLATDRDYHQSLRQRLIDNKDTCALFDSKQKVKDLEDLYFKMWEAYEKGERPKAITLG